MFKPKSKNAPVPAPNPEETGPEIDPELSLKMEVADEDSNHDDEIEQGLDEDDLREEFFLQDEEEISGEDEEDRRHRIHIQKKKTDKIFNNSFNSGDSSHDPSEEMRVGFGLQISKEYRDSHLHDPDKYRDFLDRKILMEDIETIVETSPEIRDLIANEPGKKKFSRAEINLMFGIIKRQLKFGPKSSVFISPTYILEAISNITLLEYKKLFDNLDYEFKEDLLNELDEKYNILDQHKSRGRRLF